MNRRSVIKNFLLVSAGVSLVPACIHDKGKASFLLKNINMNGEQEKMLATLCDTILPTTDGAPGAKELSSHLFVMTMVDDCLTKDDPKRRIDQNRFMSGMAAFEKLAQDKYSTDFIHLKPEQKKELLTNIEAKNKIPNLPQQPGIKQPPIKEDKIKATFTKDVTDETAAFYNTVKSFTIQSFTSSQYFLTKVQVYELVPGRYHGCVPVKTA